MGDAAGDDGLELDDVTVALRDMVSASQELAVRMARTLGINTTDVEALYLLQRHGPMGAVELAERLGIRSASATVLIDRLEAAGHAVRRRQKGDRRRITVSPTDAALRTSMAAWWPSIRAIDEVAGAMRADERRVVLAYLTAVAAAMSPDAADG